MMMRPHNCKVTRIQSIPNNVAHHRCNNDRKVFDTNLRKIYC